MVFCTAYDQYALQAFEVNAIAYLLKPVRGEALAQALARAEKLNRLQIQQLKIPEKTQKMYLKTT